MSHAAQRLPHYGLARLASGHTTRAQDWHLAEEGLGLDRQRLALLGVLLLRGPQTPGELKGRSERLAPFATLDEVERVLAELAGRGYVRRTERRPGQKEDRFRHLLGSEDEAADSLRRRALWRRPRGARCRSRGRPDATVRRRR